MLVLVVHQRSFLAQALAERVEANGRWLSVSKPACIPEDFVARLLIVRCFVWQFPRHEALMVPTKLTLSNFMCYRADGGSAGPPALVFDGLHVVCLSGENGSGKSALLDALTWALWGEARMADDDLIAQGQGEMSVDLEFQLGEQAYRIIRRRQRGGSGKRGGTTAGKSQLDFQLRNGLGWRPAGEISVRETQITINNLLRMSYQTFINASFLLQGRADEFTARTPSERKQVLADMLDLGEYERLATKAKERAKGFADQLTGLRSLIEHLEQSAGKLSFWTTSVQEASEQATRRGAVVTQAEQAQADADARLRDLQTQADQRKSLLRELERLRNEQTTREHELAKLRGQISTAETLVARAGVIARGLTELAAVQTELERLNTLSDEYNRLLHQQAELRQQFSEAKGELRAQFSSLEQRRDQLERSAARRETLLTEIRMLGDQLVGLEPLALERTTCSEERHALDLRTDEMTTLRRRHDQLETQIKLRLTKLTAQRDEQQRAIQMLTKQLADEPRWQQGLAAAQTAAAQLADAEPHHAALRAEEQQEVDAVSQLRAECARLKTAADKLKGNQKLLADAGGACPVCRSELGSEGIAHVQAHYETELVALRAAYGEAKRQADAGDERLKQVRATTADLERHMADWRRVAAQSTALADQLHQAAAWRATQITTQATYAQLETEIAERAFEPTAQAELITVAAELTALGDPAALAHQRKRLDERLRELDKRLRERDKAEGQRQANQSELARTEAELTAQPALLSELAALRRTIEENDFAHAIRSAGQQVNEAIAILDYSAETHTTTREQARALAHWTKEEQALRLAEQQRATDGARLAHVEQLQAQGATVLAQRTREDALLEQTLRGLPDARAEASARGEALREARHSLQAAQNDLVEKRTHLKRAQDDADQLAREREQERTLTHQEDLFSELAEAFGKKGVQAMLIETAIPQIEDEANRLLGRMTDGQMHLSFEMQRDTKKGDTIETLEIKLADALGTRVYDAFSGGEAMRANFAVRIALSRLLARRAGARLETLVIDEGFGTLDTLGRERMVEAITSVQDDFRRIIVITHIDELKDRFPVQIEITKTALGSHWEVR